MCVCELEVVGRHNSDWDGVETEVDIEDVAVNESVLGLDGTTSCSRTELLEEGLRTRFIPDGVISVGQ